MLDFRQDSPLSGWRLLGTCFCEAGVLSVRFLTSSDLLLCSLRRRRGDFKLRRLRLLGSSSAQNESETDVESAQIVVESSENEEHSVDGKDESTTTLSDSSLQNCWQSTRLTV